MYDLGNQTCKPEETFSCPVEVVNQVAYLKGKVFTGCCRVMSMESYLKLCSFEVCDYLKSGNFVSEAYEPGYRVGTHPVPKQ